jgi:ribokinase
MPEHSTERHRPRIVVVGGSNTDLVARAPRLPLAGETLLGESYFKAAGGKGANQAVAAARLGAHVTFVCRLGADDLGDQAMAGFIADGIDTRQVVRDPACSSGVALIAVDMSSGDNSIIVIPGANGRLGPADVEAAEAQISAADMLVCQLESPLETTLRALEIARKNRVPAILNPAPARDLPDSLLGLVSVLTPNETEAALLSGGDASTPLDSAQRLLARGAGCVIVTLGPQGALIVDNEGERRVPGRAVARVVDTTGAGDCFTGALAVALSEGKTIDESAAFATQAASLSVTRAGAQPGMPFRREIDS